MRLAILAALLIAGCSPGANFDRAKWRDADLTSRARADMLPDFLARHPLKGMSRQEVIAFLGPPTTTDTRRRADMIYVLGSEGSYFAIDNEWLFINLDRHNRVAFFEHRRIDLHRPLSTQKRTFGCGYREGIGAVKRGRHRGQGG